MSKTSNTMLKRNGESGYPCVVPDFSGKTFNFSPLVIILAVSLSQITFIMMKYVPSILTFTRVLS